MLITKVRFFKSVAVLLLWSLGMVSVLGQGAGASAVITPGEGIGRVLLGQKLDEVHASLGAPKLSDAAMGGRLWEIWRSGPAFEGKRQNGSEELEIYFTREQSDLGGPSLVRQIRVTSPFFRTPSGISIRNSFSEIIAELSKSPNRRRAHLRIERRAERKGDRDVCRSDPRDRLRVSQRCICGSDRFRLLSGDSCFSTRHRSASDGSI